MRNQGMGGRPNNNMGFNGQGGAMRSQGYGGMGGGMEGKLISV